MAGICDYELASAWVKNCQCCFHSCVPIPEQAWAARRRCHLSVCGHRTSQASAVLNLEGRPRGGATSVSCSLRWHGRWHLPRQRAQCRSHEINMISVAQLREWRDKQWSYAVSSCTGLWWQYDMMRFDLIQLDHDSVLAQEDSCVSILKGRVNEALLSRRMDFSNIHPSVSLSFLCPAASSAQFFIVLGLNSSHVYHVCLFSSLIFYLFIFLHFNLDI